MKQQEIHGKSCTCHNRGNYKILVNLTSVHTKSEFGSVFCRKV